MEHGSHESDVLSLFRERGELSRTDVISITGLSRSTVNSRLAALVGAELLAPVEGGLSTGGRPSSRFVFRAERAVVLCADIGATGFIAARCDLSGASLDQVERAIEIHEGPERVLEAVREAFTELANGAEVSANAEVWGIAIGVPGPVEFAAGRVVNPPIMTGWDRYDIVEWARRYYDAPVFVENDANARAIAEARVNGFDNVIGLKLGTGIGAGLVFNGQIVRGHQGAAGDIGHTRAAMVDPEPRECQCGNSDCVEAYASGWALLRELQSAGIPVSRVQDIVDLVRRGDAETLRRVRHAGRVIGEAVADLVSILNPRLIALSGQLAECDEVLMSGIRERLYRRATPLMTKDLVIERSTLGGSAGVIGLAHIASDALLSRVSLDELFASQS